MATEIAEQISKDISISFREQTDRLDKLIRTLPDCSVANTKSELELGCKYEHIFVPGLYIRKMFIPKGLVIVTKIHKTEHPFFIMSGDVLVNADRNKIRITAPYSGITTSGTRRALITLEDTLWITVHVTDKTDLEEISKDIVCDSYEEYDLFKQKEIV